MSSNEEKKILIEINPFIPISLNLARYLENSGWNVYVSKYYFHIGESIVKSFAKKYGFKLLESDMEVINGNLDFSCGKLKKMVMFYQKMSISYECVTRKITREYFSYLSAIQKEGITHVLVHNGVASVSALIAEDLKLQVYYIENGYFPQTLQMDSKGVNSDASFSNVSFKDFLELEVSKNTKLRKLSYFNIQNYQLNKTELIFSFVKDVFTNIRYYGLSYELSYLLNLYRLIKKYSIIKHGAAALLEDQISLPDHITFIPLQVHDDTQVLFNSPFRNIEEFLETSYFLIKDLLPESKIVVKKHPLDKNYNYNNIKNRYNDIIWLNNYSITKILDKTDYVFVLNSSVGLQALSKYKKVFLFGNSFYKNNPFVHNVSLKRNSNSEPTYLTEKEYTVLEKREIDIYMSKFKELFMNGDLFKFDTNTLHEICSRII